MRDYSYYLDKAKEVQGFKFDNQIDQALGFKASMTTYLRQGKKNISDEKMIELAKLAGIDEATALIDLNYIRAPDNAKPLYTKIAEMIQQASMAALILTVSSAPALASEGVSESVLQYILWK